MVKRFFPFFTGAAIAVGIFAAVVVVAQNSAAEKITFPIAELGNCQSKAECRAYCDEPANIKACVRFAANHGLISAKEKNRAEKFSDVLQNGGPGGCKSANECRAYCEAPAHGDECLSFAEKHNLLDDKEIAEMHKVREALRTGEKLPGGCTDKRSCQTYCQEPAHAEECLAFAEKHGLVDREEAERARKFLPLLEKGETPGGCKSREQCEEYCEQDQNREECLAFAEKSGLLSGEELANLKKTKGEGPGGCRSRQACETFCNDPANQEVCVDFAKEHGLVSAEQAGNIREGLARLRAGLSQAPPEVADCLKSEVDSEIISKLENGRFTPKPEISEKIRECFENHMSRVKDSFRHEFQAKPEIEECLKAAVGEDVLKKIKDGAAPPDTETAAQIRECFEKFAKREQQQPEMMEHSTSTPATQNLEMMKDCVRRKLGPDLARELAEGKVAQTDEVKAVMAQCVQEFRAEHGGAPAQRRGFEERPESGRHPENMPQAHTPPSGMENHEGRGEQQSPAAIEQCKRQVIGEGTGATTLTPEMRYQLEECMRGQNVPVVQGAMTTSLFGRVLHWLLDGR